MQESVASIADANPQAGGESNGGVLTQRLDSACDVAHMPAQSHVTTTALLAVSQKNYLKTGRRTGWTTFLDHHFASG
jgi:hypothetical protein